MTPHGAIETPVFFPVATAGAMRGLTHEHLLELGAEVLLCNTYHLHVQPGEATVEAAGGLHRFIGWNRPILTDSGGFQVFSLKSIRTITEAGVAFRSHRNGAPVFLGPVESTVIQHRLGSDILMCFDECPPSTAPRSEQVAAVERTLRWAQVCRDTHLRLCDERGLEPHQRPLQFGIVQGGLERDLRERCAQELVAMGFEGYAVGGLAVGETEAEMYDVLDVVCPILPAEKPRYLMGVGRVEQHRAAVARGIDLFDCVLPMREARHGTLLLSNGEKLRIRRAEHTTDFSPIDADSPSRLGRTYSKAYLAHLFRAGERLAETIACHQNMGVTLEAMRRLRGEIEQISLSTEKLA
jgi:queuine tRNA-ribosyltransferase